MKKGDWRINEPDWRMDHRNVTPPTGWWERLDQVGRSGVRTERENGRLVCVWNAGRGRWDSAPVGVEATARLAARIYDLLPENGTFIPKMRLVTAAEQNGTPAVALPGLIWVMNQFDLLRLPATREPGSSSARPNGIAAQREV
jgi:hypothetical protein